MHQNEKSENTESSELIIVFKFQDSSHEYCFPV